MTTETTEFCTVFDGHRRLAGGALTDVALAMRAAVDAGASGPLLVFNDATGRVIDLDLRGTNAEIIARFRPAAPQPATGEPEQPEPSRTRGRPKLGVVAREITLLPRHWEWLAKQPGGASVALRKLIDEARKSGSEREVRKAAHERAYRFMSAMAGDLAGFEEAARALFANDRARMEDETATWPQDVRAHSFRLAFPEEAG